MENIDNSSYGSLLKNSETRKIILKWERIAYDLAWALQEEMPSGFGNGPPKPLCYPPCDCLTHRALENWGKAQAELLNQLDPDWEEKMYQRWQNQEQQNPLK